MVLLGVAAVLGAFVVLQIARFFVSAAEADTTVAKVSHPAVGKTDTSSEQQTQVKSAVEMLKKKNLFAVPAERQHPVNEVIGILGNQALISGQWYKAGDSVGDAKVIAIEPTKVRIAWNGQEKEFMPIGSAGSGGPGGPDRGRREGPSGPPGRSGAASMVATGPRPGVPPAGGPPGGPSGLSPGERDRLRDRWTNMSPEEREKLRDEMRERLGRRDR
jgi:hypothetical protein